MNRHEMMSDLAARIMSVRRDHPVRVAIDGVDASGKTTLADELAVPVSRLGRPVIRASLDGFHNPAVIRGRRGPLSAEGYYLDSFDYNALIAELLAPLGPDGSLRYRRKQFDYRFDAPQRTQVEEAAADAVLLFDGVFLLRPELRPFWDYVIFVHADFDIVLQRALERDRDLFGSVEDVRRRYEQRYIPGQQLYLTRVQPTRWADVVVDNNDPLRPNFMRG